MHIMALPKVAALSTEERHAYADELVRQISEWIVEQPGMTAADVRAAFKPRFGPAD
jgi:hypothetical protein